MPNAASWGVKLGVEWIGGNVFTEDSVRLIELQEEETILFGTVVNTGIDESAGCRGINDAEC
jgi:hypothetical protein